MDEVIFKTQEDAEAVLKRLREMVEKHEATTVSDLYDLSGIGEMITYQDHRLGWFRHDLQNVTISAVDGGFKLDLPQPESLV